MRYRILRTIFLAIMFASGMAACSDQSSSEQAAWYNRNNFYSYSADEGNLWNKMRRNLHLSNYTYTRAVHEQIHWYQTHPDHFDHIITESAPYIYYIYQQTQQHRLPAELALIPVIESEYNPYARSKTGALGLWQMMPSTARGFGLKRDWWYDGRKDVVASTQAALEYFTYLHEYFNDNWLLAIAAYDCGEGTVTACMRYNRYHGHATDFWNLPLPYETQAYVPRLLAVAAIVKDPGRYHMHLPPINDAPFVEQVDIGSPISLSKAAKLADVPVDTMKALNPGVQHGKTDPHGPYTILVPEDKAQTFKEKVAALTHNEKILWQQHVVESKETLEKIAQKYRITVALLKKVNGLKSEHVHPNQTLLIPPSSPETQLATNSAQNLASVTKTNSQQIIYEVQTGDDLWHVAEKYGVSINDLMTWNHLTVHQPLKLGDKLIIQQPNTNVAQTTQAAEPEKSSPSQTMQLAAADTSTTTTDTTPSQPTTTKYKVVPGDSLRKIAEHYHTSISKIKRASSLTSNVLQPGQILTIPVHEKTQVATTKTDATNTATTNTTTPATAAQPTTPTRIVYIVRKGDYIEKIAKHFKVSSEDILKWNQLSTGNDIQPGQKLTIHTDA